MKKYLLSFVVIVLCIIGCSRNESFVEKPNGETIVSETKEVKEMQVIETSAQSINVDDLTLDEQEELFEKYLELLGGDEPIKYREEMNSVRERGKYTKFNWGKDGDFATEEIEISYGEYLSKALKEIKENNPNIDEMADEDYKYIYTFLNLGDYGSEEMAFMEADNGIWGNNLTGVFDNAEEKKSAYVKYINLDSKKERKEYLNNLRKEFDEKNKKNEMIIKEYIDEIKQLIYGNNSDIEIKGMGITRINDRDIRFYYILGPIITSDTKELYYVEDSVKGYINEGSFVRDNNPSWDNEDLGMDIYALKDTMFIQYALKDAEYKNHAYTIEEYNEDKLTKVAVYESEYKLLPSKETSYILDRKDVFVNMDINALKNKIAVDLPLCRKLAFADGINNVN